MELFKQWAQLCKEAMSENGEGSFKRFLAATMTWAFLFECITNAIGKQRVLDGVLQTQLFEGWIISVGAVVGVTVVQAVKDLKMRQSDNAKDVNKTNT
jgi:hypothetical protein